MVYVILWEALDNRTLAGFDDLAEYVSLVWGILLLVSWSEGVMKRPLLLCTPGKRPAGNFFHMGQNWNTTCISYLSRSVFFGISLISIVFLIKNALLKSKMVRIRGFSYDIPCDISNQTTLTAHHHFMSFLVENTSNYQLTC